MISSYDASYKPLHTKDMILVGGCFDVLHYGHLCFLKQAKALGRHLVVALENDAAVVQTKDRKVFHTHQQRAEILEELSCVDEVILLPGLASYDEYLNLVQRLSPKVIALTEGDPQRANKERQAQAVGAQCLTFPFEKGFSTTDLLERYNHTRKGPMP